MKQPDPHIVFIDDGINPGVFKFNMKYDLEYHEGHLVPRLPTDHDDPVSHGTICAAIVQNYFTGFQCSSIKILDSDKKYNPIDGLIVALEWCLAEQPDIVNISLGSVNCNDKKKLLSLTNLLSANTIIVAALSNRDVETYPASFSNTIAVKAIEKEDVLFKQENGSLIGCNFSALSRHRLGDSITKNSFPGKTNSFAAPFMTAQICNDGLIGKSCHEILLYYSHCTAPIIQGVPIYRKPDWIENALIFSNTEIDVSLLPYRHHIIQTEFISRNIAILTKGLDIALFDTFVFIWGNPTPLSFKNECITFASIHNKNVVVIDRTIEIDTVDTSSIVKKFVYSPSKIKATSHYEIDVRTPIIAIYSFYEKKLLTKCFQVSSDLKEKGYCPSLLFNLPQAILYEEHCVNFLTGDSAYYINEIDRSQNSDLIICGAEISASNVFDSILFFESIQADIHVFIDSDIGVNLPYLGTNNSFYLLKHKPMGIKSKNVLEYGNIENISSTILKVFSSLEREDA